MSLPAGIWFPALLYLLAADVPERVAGVTTVSLSVKIWTFKSASAR